MKKYVTDDGYDSPHNSKVTWEQHLQQTSEWEGSMWGKNSDFIGVEEFGKRPAPTARHQRTGRVIGSTTTYASIACRCLCLQVWQKPLPRVLKDEIMDRIGASNTWQYHGYDNSTVKIKGRPVESVSGGTRWGGGLWISTRDQARFGYLFLRQGKWKDKQLISENWIRVATTPTTCCAGLWLSLVAQYRKASNGPVCRRTSFAALGYGSNTSGLIRSTIS